MVSPRPVPTAKRYGRFGHQLIPTTTTNVRQPVTSYLCSVVTHSHTTVLRPLFRDHPGEPVPQEEIFFWTKFMVQGKITEADTPTIRLRATPSRLISDPPPSPPLFFTPDVLPAATIPIYPGLRQAPNMLDCTPSGFVSINRGSISPGF